MKNIFTVFVFVLTSIASYSQNASSRLKFNQAQVFNIEVNMKSTIAQQAMGQSIDFVIDSKATHDFKVTNSTEDNTTLHHEVKKISFAFDGMGQKVNFDSEKEKDLNGQFGKPMKDMLNKKYDIIIDTGGKVLMAMPEKFVVTEMDGRMAIINSMLKDIMDLVQPPQKGKPSFFQLLPSSEIKKADTWTTTALAHGGKVDAAFKIADINDSTIIVDFVENSVTIAKANMMGSETTTTMNNKSTGKIILDRTTGIMKEKTFSTDSHGNTEASFGTMPVTSKTTTTIKVKPE